ncbi:MAG: excinuclease ABC subunit UvrC [Desulfosalsimonadaceae bacterium]
MIDRDLPVENTLAQQLPSISSGPGVYLMKDDKGKIIYVGKAANLKKRLASYFIRQSHPDLKTGVLVKQIASFETIVTPSENEALILESTLIKKHKPRYNILLKDDKRYPSIRIDITADYPCLQVVRKTGNDQALYFGPYTSPGSVRDTIKIINKTFKLCKCECSQLVPRSRPCLNFQMGLCLAPCCYPVDRQVYKEMVEEVRMFLNGRIHDLIRKFTAEMTAAAEKQAFEEAARLRDKIFALQNTVEKQIAVTTDFVDRDVISLARNDMVAVVVALLVRNGFLQAVRQFVFKDAISSDHEIIDAFVKQYYGKSDYIPKEIIVPLHLEDEAVVAGWLGEMRESAVHVIVPKRGDKLRLLAMAAENARTRLTRMMDEMAAGRELLEGLARRLQLRAVPKRIECFDNSGMSGSNLVSGMVVFIDGKPEKKSYRKYTIKTVDLQDDYASMNEVLERRFKKSNQDADLPDLLMVDGGRGQLNIAVSVIERLGLKNAFGIIGIAKKDVDRNEPTDKIYLPGRVNPVNFGKDMEAMFLLQRIRDEAHRFAITFHRQKRGKTALHSSLDAIPGIGKKRKAALMRKFSSFQKLREASVEELADTPGINLAMAKALFSKLNNRQ